MGPNHAHYTPSKLLSCTAVNSLCEEASQRCYLRCYLHKCIRMIRNFRDIPSFRPCAFPWSALARTLRARPFRIIYHVKIQHPIQDKAMDFGRSTIHNPQKQEKTTRGAASIASRKLRRNPSSLKHSPFLIFAQVLRSGSRPASSEIGRSGSFILLPAASSEWPSSASFGR